MESKKKQNIEFLIEKLKAFRKDSEITNDIDGMLGITNSGPFPFSGFESEMYLFVNEEAYADLCEYLMAGKGVKSVEGFCVVKIENPSEFIKSGPFFYIGNMIQCANYVDEMFVKRSN